MSLDSYANLKTEIQNWLADDDIADYVDSFIVACESTMRRTIRIPELMTKEQVTISDGDRTTDLTSLTASVLDLKSIRILEASTNYSRFAPSLQQMNLNQLSEHSLNVESRPTAFTVYGTTVEYNVEADQNYTAEFFFWKNFTALSDANTSNEILVAHPDLYLWGSLTASAPFLGNDERLQVWGNLYANAVAEVRRVAQENNLGGPLKVRTNGVAAPRRY